MSLEKRAVGSPDGRYRAHIVNVYYISRLACEQALCLGEKIIGYL